MRFPGLDLLVLLLREAMCTGTLERRPEPCLAMTDEKSVESFHSQGAICGALAPVYHFNALACSKLLPKGGVLLDLGSGSGQFLSYLAQARPDIRIIGLELSATMVNLGRASVKAAGLDHIIELIIGDMTHISLREIEQVHLISSIFSLHHLPTYQDLAACLKEVSRIQKACGCGVWIFDHDRPKHLQTAAMFPEIYTPEASARFRLDSYNSLRAAFSYAELTESIDEASTEKFEHQCSRLLRLYQAHWLPCKTLPDEDAWKGATLSGKSAKEFTQLRWLFNRNHIVAPVQGR